MWLWWGNMKERVHLEENNISMDLEKTGYRGVWSGFIWHRITGSWLL
jgi:hypothetical protein